MTPRYIPRTKKSKKPKQSKCKVKVKNKTVNKLRKRGLYDVERKLRNKKEKKKDKLKTYSDHMREKQSYEENKIEEDEITGEEMMEMMDKDDLPTFEDYYGEKKNEDSEPLFESEERRNIADGDGSNHAYDDDQEKVVKPLLPVLTDEGWEYKEEEVPVSTKELTMNDFKRKKAMDFLAEKNDDDRAISGIDDETAEDLDELPTYKKKHEDYTGKSKSVAQIWAEQKRSIHEKKVQMACLALNIVRKPNQIPNLRALIKMLKEANPVSEVTIRKFVTITLLQVFHDQIPGYRMRDQKPNHQLKKETLAAVTQEMNFLTCYRVYLRNLEDVLESWKKDPTNLGLQILSDTSLFCLGDLLVLHPHFNYSVNIVQALVPYLNHKSLKMRTTACDALSRTMKVDMHCYLALEMVRRIYKLTQRSRYRVKGELLRVFYAIPMNNMSNPDSVSEQHNVNARALTHKEKLIKKLAQKSGFKPSRKQKKDNKKMAKIRTQMAEINTNEALTTQNSRNTEILQKVFGIYFHVLKLKPNSALMPDVLEGLARFAHLISIDYFSDILAVMNGFLEAGTLGKRESLHCIQTVFTILSGQGESLNLDPQKFDNEFYRLLLELLPREMCQNLDIVLEIVEQMLIMRRNRVSTPKVISFAKRLATVSLTLPHQAALPLLISLKKLFTTFSSVETLLETDAEGSPGVFLAEISDPEHSNAASSTVWELALAQKYYHPHVRVVSKSILSGVPALEVREVHELTKIPFKKLIEDLDISKLKFKPSIPDPAPHLASKKKTKKQVFQEGSLVLDDLKLQRIVDRVLADEEAEDEPRKKKLKTSLKAEGKKDASSKIESLDFYQNVQAQKTLNQIEKNDDAQQTRESSETTNAKEANDAEIRPKRSDETEHKESSTNEDLEQTEENKNFLSYLIGTK